MTVIPFFRNTYEDLVRKILKADNDPAVIQLFMTMEDSTSAQTQHLYVGFNYDLPRISYREAVLKKWKKAVLHGKRFHLTISTPTTRAMQLSVNYLWNFLNSVYLRMDSLAASEYVLKAPCPQKPMQIPSSWTVSRLSPGRWEVLRKGTSSTGLITTGIPIP